MGSGDEIAIPKWLAQSLIPATIILAVGSGVTMWRDLSVAVAHLAYIESRVKQFEQFRDKGRRFTAEDGKRLESRIYRLEKQLRDLRPINERAP